MVLIKRCASSVFSFFSLQKVQSWRTEGSQRLTYALTSFSWLFSVSDSAEKSCMTS